MFFTHTYRDIYACKHPHSYVCTYVDIHTYMYVCIYICMWYRWEYRNTQKLIYLSCESLTRTLTVLIYLHTHSIDILSPHIIVWVFHIQYESLTHNIDILTPHMIMWVPHTHTHSIDILTHTQYSYTHTPYNRVSHSHSVWVTRTQYKSHIHSIDTLTPHMIVAVTRTHTHSIDILSTTHLHTHPHPHLHPHPHPHLRVVGYTDIHSVCISLDNTDLYSYVPIAW